MKKQEKILEPTVKVGVLVPSAGMWEMEFGRALVSLFAHTLHWRPDPALGCERMSVNLYCLSGSMLVTNRQKLIAQALKDNCTHILFIDDDMVFPKDALIRLLSSGKPAIGGNYTTRSFPVNWVGQGFDGKPISSKKKHGLQKVQYLGCGMLMVRRSVLEKLSVPLFMMEWIPDIPGFCGEDVYFCAKIQKEAEEDIWVDHDLSKQLRHVGKLQYHSNLIDHELPAPESRSVKVNST